MGLGCSEREFGNVWFGNETRVSVWVELKEDNRAVLLVAAQGQGRGRPFYACDAACLDPPVLLKSAPQVQARQGRRGRGRGVEG